MKWQKNIISYLRKSARGDSGLVVKYLEI